MGIISGTSSISAQSPPFHYFVYRVCVGWLAGLLLTWEARGTFDAKSYKKTARESNWVQFSLATVAAHRRLKSFSSLMEEKNLTFISQLMPLV